MVKSNEFTADSFAGAIKNATAAYDRSQLCEVKNQRRCNDLVLEMTGLSREATRFADEAERLEDDAEKLRREAILAGFLGLAGLLSGGFALALLKSKRAARALGRMRKGDYSRNTILEFLGAFGPLGAIASGLVTVEKLREAEELMRRAQNLSDSAESLGQDYMRAFNEYDRIGCGEGLNFTGT